MAAAAAVVSTLAPRAAQAGQEAAADKVVVICAAVLLQQHASGNTVAATHALLALNAVMLGKQAREGVRKNAPLLRAIRQLGMSAEGDAFAAAVAANLFASLGTGDRLVKSQQPPGRPSLSSGPVAAPIAASAQPPAPRVGLGPAPAATPVSAQTVQPPPRLPSFGSSPLSGAAYAGMSPPPTTPLPPSSVASQPPRTTMMMPPPPPPPPQQPAMLPTYSSVSSAGLRQTPQRPPPAHSVAEDRASLELAMRLQAEERTAAQRSQAPAPPRPQTWSCAACTYENKGTAGECEVCGTKRPGAGAPSSTAAGPVTVKCPKCTKLCSIASPASSPLFVCMSCNTTSRTDQHRV